MSGLTTRSLDARPALPGDGVDRDGGKAARSEQAEASFTATELSDSGFTVENLRHDFPQRRVACTVP